MSGPLSDLKIIEVGEMVSAPYAAKLMADMGAEVIKIERPGVGDRASMRGPFPGGTPDPEKSGIFLYLNTNKLAITLDLAQPEGFEIFEKLIASADLLIHNVVPPDMDRVGLSYDRLCRINPSLIMTSVLPYGLSGPKRDWRAENLNLWCAGGVCYLNGGGPASQALAPLKTFGDQAGYQGAAHAAAATMGALMARIRDQTGQHVEVSVQESVAAELEMTFEYWPYIRQIASRLGQKPLQPVEIFQCKDGYIYVCCIEEHQWRAFVESMGNPEWASMEIFGDRLQRGLNWDALRPFIDEYVSQQTVLDLYRKAQDRRIPFAPVSTMGDLLNSDHLKARGFFVEIAQPAAGTHKYPGAPVKFSRTPWEIRIPAPALGQHNSEILGRHLGFAPARLKELERKGVI
jgi:crotonobetainyl-CoA:carnitine CoA-transferase CaiB-like acyl-CoA transferase